MFKHITLFLILTYSINNAHAAFITIDEAGLDEIYSQSGFGDDIVDIRIGPATELVRPDLLNINTGIELFSLFGLHVGGFNIVNFYFVDTIDWCGNTNSNYIGCGEWPGNDFVVESTYAARPDINAELLGHELGHNLNLDHRSGSQNLMNASINGGTLLNSTEISTLRRSSLVQGDADSGYYIMINPVLVVAEASKVIPEPSTTIILLSGLVLITLKRNKKH